MRQKLPDRREGETIVIPFKDVNGATHQYIATFGFNADLEVKEVFCASGKSGADVRMMLEDSCVLLSLCLQHGMSIEDAAKAMGERRGEGAKSGPPASPLGAIVKKAAVFQEVLRLERAGRREFRKGLEHG